MTINGAVVCTNWYIQLFDELNVVATESDGENAHRLAKKTLIDKFKKDCQQILDCCISCEKSSTTRSNAWTKEIFKIKLNNNFYDAGGFFRKIGYSFLI